jgi:hypothetical protein
LDKFIFGVLNTNLFNGNNAKKNLFELKNGIVFHTMKSKENSLIFFQIVQFCGGIGGKTSPRPGNSLPSIAAAPPPPNLL